MQGAEDTNTNIHPYYTPKSCIFQVNLPKSPIFVNYDDFYVTGIMLISETNASDYLSFSTISAIYRGCQPMRTPNIVYARIDAF